MKQFRADAVGEGVAVFLTAVQTEQLFQIISLILTVLSICVSLAFTIYKWWKEAKKDGKIDNEEIKEITEDVKESVDKISDAIQEHNKEKDKND